MYYNVCIVNLLQEEAKMPNSICCKDLPINPHTRWGTKAESGCVKVENLRHEVLVVTKQSEHSIHVDWTHSSHPMLLDFMKQRVCIQIRENGIAFWDDSYPEFVRSIRNVPAHWQCQIKEVKKLLDMMDARYTSI